MKIFRFRKVSKTIRYLLLIIGAIFLIVFIWLVATSAKLKALISSNESKAPSANLPVTGNVATAGYTPSSPSQVVLDKILKEIKTDYTVLASDSNKRLFVTLPVTLNFSDEGTYNVVIRAYPVAIKVLGVDFEETTNVSAGTNALDVGDYYFEMKSGILRLI